MSESERINELDIDLNKLPEDGNKEMATMMEKFRDTEARMCSRSHKRREFRGKREARRLSKMLKVTVNLELCTMTTYPSK